MPDKDGCYEFKELSKKAQEQAIEKWRENGWDFDQHDSQQLTETFKEYLVEKGFLDDVNVNWSLGYCQGDGVCFSGHIDAAKLFHQKGWKKYKKFADRISIKVTNSDSRYCHWNSMSVEVSFSEPSIADLIPQKTYEQMTEWQVARALELRIYEERSRKIDKERVRPIMEWNEFKSDMRNNVLAWLPEAPEPLNLPYPDRPADLIEPERFVTARERAEEKIKEMEAEVGKIEEDVSEWVKDLSKEMEKTGYEEIEYRGSDEVIIETIEANEYTFTEDGDMC